MLIFIFGATSCQDVNSLVDSIARRNTVECQAIGFAGSSSTQYKRFEKIRRKASKEELISLTKHDSLAVVVYASYALIDNELIDPSVLLGEFLKDTNSVSTFCGCLMGGESVPSLIYHRYWSERVDYPDSENYNYRDYVINDSESLRRMDSLILYSENPDWILLNRALQNRIYNDKFRSRIEEWAFKENEFYALQYIFRNSLSENKDKLEAGLSEYLEGEDIYEAEIEEINQMLKEIKKY